MKIKTNKTFVLIAVIIIIIISILAIYIHNYLRGPKIKVENSFLDPREDVERLVTFEVPTFTSLWPDFPKQLPILNISQHDFQTELTDKLKQKCQITANEQNTYFLGKNCNFFVYPQNITLTMNTDVALNLDVNLTQAQETAQKILTELYGSNTNFSLAGYNYQYDSDTDVHLDNDHIEGVIENHINENSNTVRLFYVPAYNQYPISQHSHVFDKSVIINMDADNRLTMAELPKILPTFSSSTQEYSLITQEEAIKNIANNQAYLTTYSLQTNTENAKYEADISKLHNINLNTVSLEYRLNDEQTQAIPCYHFVGTAINNNNDTVDVEIVTPAINFTLSR